MRLRRTKHQPLERANNVCTVVARSLKTTREEVQQTMMRRQAAHDGFAMGSHRISVRRCVFRLGGQGIFKAARAASA